MTTQKILVLAFIGFFTFLTSTAQVGIGTTTPDTSSALDVDSTTQGFLPPRMTEVQRDAIVAPVAPGLIIWCTDCGSNGETQVYNGTAWTNMMGGAASVNPNPTVKICNQEWTTNNLDVVVYRNGDPIPQVTDPAEWAALTTGAWCYYDNDPANGPIYGKLYNQYAVNDPRGLAPEGFHIPTLAEFQTLSACQGGNSVSGNALKETGVAHWPAPNADATNSSGFTALPGGKRWWGTGNFQYEGTNAQFWSTTYAIGCCRWTMGLNSANGTANFGYEDRHVGLSVRCIKNS